MSRTRSALAGILASTLLASTACAGGEGQDPTAESSSPTASQSGATTGATTPAPSAAAPTPAPRAVAPRVGACYRLRYTQAVAPTVDARPVPCSSPHTARTFATGRLDLVVDGHLLAVDSDRVQRQVRRACPASLRQLLGGTAADQRLSMLRAVWFTPTLAEADAGADWYRCDVVAIAAEGRLALLDGRLAGVLDDSVRRARYAMCGTAEPGTPRFRRVICSRPHAWRAVATVDLPGRRYPGEAGARAAGQARCEEVGRAAAEDPLEFRWGYEWPTEEQWAAGQRYGICWILDRARTG